MLAVPAYAKVNLALEVTGRRSDGFHDLVTVFATLDWHDLVSVELTDGTGTAHITVDGPTADPSMADPGSLLDRAAQAIRDLIPPARPHLGIRIHVHKRLPVAAGLGGGSADAAAVLRACVAELTRRGVTVAPSDLATAAARLGSDVPALLRGGVTRATGRGEILEPIPQAPRLHVSIAVAGASSTAAVYAALTERERHADGRARRVAADLAAGRPPNPADCGSALEPAAFRVNPELAVSLQNLRNATGLRWPLTGSGGAAFHLATDAREAEAAAAAARGLGLVARPCHTVTNPFPDPPVAKTTIPV
jgi:4-diphosphocytidyl-2-C-methyl-D-erythritol kinase